ncbi:MAG: PAS domain S-box-containing protein [Desulforhopalus sp.]|jgi:PAS domain S-box-containing protein
MNGISGNRIAVKLVLWLVVVSSVFTLLGTVTELYFDYHGRIERLTLRLGEVTESCAAEVQRVIDAGDTESVSVILKDLLRGPIAYAAVIVNDKISYEKGDSDRRYKVESSKSFLVNQQKEFDAALLKVVTDIAPIRADIYQKFLHSLIANGIKIFLIAAFVFLMFQYLVTRHLEEIAKQIQQQDITKPSEPISLKRAKRYQQDELDKVVSDLNAMRDKARNALIQLEKNEERLLLFFDSTEEAILGVNREGICSFVNDSCMEMLGERDYEAVIGHPVESLFQYQQSKKSNHEQGCGVIELSMERGRPVVKDDGYLRFNSGDIVAVSCRSYPTFASGEVSGAIVFIKDNREKKQLIHDRDLLAQAVDQSPVMIVIADDKNKIEYVNPGTVRWSGYSKDELLGNLFFSFVNPSAEGALTVKQLKQKLENGQKWEGVIRTNSKWGSSVTVYCIISPVFDNDNMIVNTIAVCKEVSYEAALQEELLNSKKMEAVGRLSANFAHEFGNPLFGVRAVLKDVSERLSFSKEDEILLQLANNECDRMRGMVREFQKVYLESKSSGTLLEILPVIESVIREEARLQAENISYSISIEVDASKFLVSKNKLILVVRNIICNSIDAMHGLGGCLRIEGKIENDSLLLCISDTGRGIKKEYQELVLEPFFSTKPEVEGAGLGLSVAYGTMKSIGGTITFSSTEDEGTHFFVRVPFSC